MTWLPVAAFVFVNVAVLGLTGYKLFVRQKTANWPGVPGVVRSSRISFDSSADRTGGTALVEYDYAVNGRPYHSNVRTPDDIVVGGNRAAAAVVARYPAGTPVTVFVNPADPADAFLEHTVVSTGGTLFLLLAGNAIAAAIAIVYTVMF